jgi:hypothetical protein
MTGLEVSLRRAEGDQAYGSALCSAAWVIVDMVPVVHISWQGKAKSKDSELLRRHQQSRSAEAEIQQGKVSERGSNSNLNSLFELRRLIL